MKRRVVLFGILAVMLLFAACKTKSDSDGSENVLMENNFAKKSSVGIDKNVPKISAEENEDNNLPAKNGLITAQILAGADGDIHYGYYLPEKYDKSKDYPLVMVMPGYDMMWFGEDSLGSNLNWNGFLVWTRLKEDMIVVSAQLTDWGEKSARQAIELTEYFINNFSVNVSRVYAVGYSAGGETMSQAVSSRPDLYTAYLHCASQWDGTYEEVAENNVAVYIFTAENDEYYGSKKARDAYNALYDAYLNAGLKENQIEDRLKLEIPDNRYFNSQGIYHYHGGANILFQDEQILNWITEKRK